MTAERKSFNAPRAFAIVLIAIAFTLLLYFLSGWLQPRTITSEQIEQGLQGSSRATINISSSVSEMRVTGLNDADTLIAGKVNLIAGEKAAKQFKQNGDTATYELRSEWPGNKIPQQNHLWDLALNTRVPLNLTVRSGIGQTTLDLQAMQLERLNVTTDLGSLEVTLSKRGRYAATLETGVGESTVTIPSGVAARVRVNRGIGDVNIPDGFKRDGDTYVSPDFETAEHRVDLTIKGGVGTITVRANK